MKTLTRAKLPLAIVVATLGLSGVNTVWAQDSEVEKSENTDTDSSAQTPSIGVPPVEINTSEIEEIVTVGRYLSTTQQLVNERIDDSYAADLLGAEMISRLGDSNVASALQRVPGVSLVDNKYVFIRGLGERYSSNTLNGAQVPSPDLTRNVIPLDIFPTTIVESLRVQKTWSSDLGANFGGGLVDIRTKSIPDHFVLGFELGTGSNDIDESQAYTYAGGSDDRFGKDDGTRAMSENLEQQISRFYLGMDEQGIRRILEAEGSNLDPAEINRQLALELNRDIEFGPANTHPDLNFKGSVGNKFLVGDNWELGFLTGASYSSGWDQKIVEKRPLGFADTRPDDSRYTTYTVDMSGVVNLGAQFLSDHEISTTSMILRTTDDEAVLRDFFNENNEVPDGRGLRAYDIKYEQRELRTHQIRGSHYLGSDTRDLLPVLNTVLGWLPEESLFEWSYTESESDTSIPNQVSIDSQTVTDPTTRAVIGEGIARSTSVANYRFTDLHDDVMDWGVDFTVPFYIGNSFVELKSGYRYNRKTRTYKQTEFSFGPNAFGNVTSFQGPLDVVFSDANILNPANDYKFNRAESSQQSYLAATMQDSAYGIAEWTYDETWRLSAGVRWEDYRHVVVGWNPYGFSETSPQVSTDPDDIVTSSWRNDEFYPALSLTYMSDFWAETFQLRFGWSETTTRPDIRESSDSSWFDPQTGELTLGNPDLRSANVSNFDMRAEWYFSSGDNLTVSLFYKDIEDPIEFLETLATDGGESRLVVNMESGEVYGIEFEGLKRFDFLGEIGELFFLQGNLTLQDSELVTGSQIANPTSPIRPMNGASEYLANLTFGFDSYEGAHTASLVYNVFGERLYTAGVNPSFDTYEEPFNSLDLTYSWFPTDDITVKLKAKNLLGQTKAFSHDGVVVREIDPGMAYALSISWAM